MRQLLLLFIGIASIISFSPVSAWQYLGGHAARALTFDASGNIIAAGSIGRDFIVVKISATDGSELWRNVRVVPPSSPIDRSSFARAVAVDVNGDVIAGGTAGSRGPGFEGGSIIKKLSGSDGTEQWRTNIGGSTATGPDQPDKAARAIATDANGDVVVAGNVVHPGTGSDFAVVKLSGVDGSVLWRAENRGPDLFFEAARTVTVDSNGDVIATGGYVALKLSGADGTELWRVPIGLHGLGTVDANGDLVVLEGGGEVPYAVVKRSPVDGSEIWRVPMDPPLTVTFFDLGAQSTIITDAQGNVVLGGLLPGSFPVVIKLSGTDGAELWRGTSDTNSERIEGLAFDGNGDVVAVGKVGSQFTVVKRSGTDGTELWRENSQTGSALAVLVDPHGDVVAGGGSASSGLTVLKLRGSDGGDFVSSAELSASPATTTPGSLITGTWSGVTTPTPTDWLGLYAVGTGHEEDPDWKYVGCEQTPTSEFASGSCQFVVSSTLAPGQYELRLFAQDGFTLLATSNAFSIDQVGAVAVQIAIRPAGSANRIDPASSGRVPVAVLSDHGFDVQTVLVDTVRFGASGTEATPVRADFSDVDGDGDTDLVLRFRIRDTGIQCGNTSALLTGQLVGGATIVGSDAIRTVRCR